MNETKSLIPPTFVNVASEPVYDAELPDALFRTYIRLRGLAWQSKYRETPPLRVEELAKICHHNVRSMWGHLSALRDRGLVTWRTVRGRMVFDLGGLPQTHQALQDFAVNDGQGAEERRQQPELLQNFAVDRPGDTQDPKEQPQALQNFAVDDADDTVQDPREQPQALQNFAVEPPALQKIAVDDANDTAQDPREQSQALQNFAVEPPALQNFAVEPPPLQNFAVGQALQNFAVHDDGGIAVTDPPETEQQQQPLLQKFAVDAPVLQNFAVTERLAANLAALAEYGVDVGEATAREAAQLDHVTPDLVRAWGEHLRGRPCRNLPGLLLYKLRTTQSPPRTGERRGGSRRETAPVGPCQDALPIEEHAEQPESEIVTVELTTGMLKRQQARTDGDAVALLLEDFGIVAPAGGQVVARSPHPDDVRGWMLYALGQPGLDGKAQGYVVNRLLAGETPPGRFRRWARLEPEEWRMLWRASRYGGKCAVDADPAAWREDFAGVFPRGPFGDGQRLASETEPVVTEPDGGSPLAAEWEAVLDDLRLQMTQATFDTWLKGSRLVRREGDTFVVEVKSVHAKEWLEHRLLSVVTRTLVRLSGYPVGVEFVVAENIEEEHS
jgi:hypothetical protein